MIIGISGKAQSGKDSIGYIIQYFTTDIKHSYNFHNFMNFKISNLTKKDIENHTNWKIKKFANTLKNMVCLLIGCTRDQLENETFKNTELGEEWWYYRVQNNIYFGYDKIPYNNWNTEKHKHLTITKLTPRLLLQLLGTECGRNIIHPNIWINSLMGNYNIELTGEVFTDTTLQGNPTKPSKRAYPNWLITDVRFPNEAKAIKDKGGIIIRVNRIRSNMDRLFDKNLMAELDEYNTNKKSNIREHKSETALDDYQHFDYIIDNNGTIDDLYIDIEEILKKENII